ncbi:hypothetical protein SNL152K_10213 [Streptomyces sp. NL15-2K]|nr:hypothetical protein SNL152K_10213 [Streptomyces sp. NL15-2K]
MPSCPKSWLVCPLQPLAPVPPHGNVEAEQTTRPGIRVPGNTG